MAAVCCPCPCVQDVSDRLDAIGFGRLQYVLLVLCGAGWLADGAWEQVTTCCIPQYTILKIQVCLSRGQSSVPHASQHTLTI